MEDKRSRKAGQCIRALQPIALIGSAAMQPNIATFHCQDGGSSFENDVQGPRRFCCTRTVARAGFKPLSEIDCRMRKFEYKKGGYFSFAQRSCLTPAIATCNIYLDVCPLVTSLKPPRVIYPILSQRLTCNFTVLPADWSSNSIRLRRSLDNGSGNSQ